MRYSVLTGTAVSAQVFYPVVLLYMLAAFFQGGAGTGSSGMLNNARSYLWIPIGQNAFRCVSLGSPMHLPAHAGCMMHPSSLVWGSGQYLLQLLPRVWMLIAQMHSNLAHNCTSLSDLCNQTRTLKIAPLVYALSRVAASPHSCYPCRSISVDIFQGPTRLDLHSTYLPGPTAGKCMQRQHSGGVKAMPVALQVHQRGHVPEGHGPGPALAPYAQDRGGHPHNGPGDLLHPASPLHR